MGLRVLSTEQPWILGFAAAFGLSSVACGNLREKLMRPIVGHRGRHPRWSRPGHAVWDHSVPRTVFRDLPTVDVGVSDSLVVAH